MIFCMTSMPKLTTKMSVFQVSLFLITLFGVQPTIANATFWAYAIRENDALEGNEWKKYYCVYSDESGTKKLGMYPSDTNLQDLSGKITVRTVTKLQQDQYDDEYIAMIKKMSYPSFLCFTIPIVKTPSCFSNTSGVIITDANLPPGWKSIVEPASGKTMYRNTNDPANWVTQFKHPGPTWLFGICNENSDCECDPAKFEELTSLFSQAAPPKIQTPQFDPKVGEIVAVKIGDGWHDDKVISVDKTNKLDYVYYVERYNNFPFTAKNIRPPTVHSGAILGSEHYQRRRLTAAEILRLRPRKPDPVVLVRLLEKIRKANGM